MRRVFCWRVTPKRSVTSSLTLFVPSRVRLKKLSNSCLPVATNKLCPSADQPMPSTCLAAGFVMITFKFESTATTPFVMASMMA